MCAIQDAGLSTSPYQNQTSNPSSNSNLTVKTRPTTGGTSPSLRSTRDSKTSPKPQQSREQKRKNWAKRSKPVAKPSVRVAPAKVYTSACCQAPATKPKAGQKEVAKDAETGKMKSGSKGLGKWRCSACSKVCKVTVHKPAPKEIVDAVRAITNANVAPIHPGDLVIIAEVAQ